MNAFLFMVFIGIMGVTGNAESKNLPALTVEMNTGNLFIKAYNARLGDLLDKISSVCRVDIRGLDSRRSETVTFVSGNGPIESELKRLLRYLNVENYSFEYGGDQLRIVSVFPISDTKGAAPPLPSNTQQEGRGKQSTVVRVEGIVAGSQAEILNLMPGDLVISYDNTRISNAGQLINLVRSKPTWERIDMMVVRDGSPVRIVVNGGQIGIQIKNVRIPSEILERYYSSY